MWELTVVLTDVNRSRLQVRDVESRAPVPYNWYLRVVIPYGFSFPSTIHRIHGMIYSDISRATIQATIIDI